MASPSVAPVPVNLVSASATSVCATDAMISTGRTGNRSSAAPATGASAVIGTVMARNTDATAHDACELWYTRLARATMASPSPAEISAWSRTASGRAQRWLRTERNTGRLLGRGRVAAGDAQCAAAGPSTRVPR